MKYKYSSPLASSVASEAVERLTSAVCVSCSEKETGARGCPLAYMLQQKLSLFIMCVSVCVGMSSLSFYLSCPSRHEAIHSSHTHTHTFSLPQANTHTHTNSLTHTLPHCPWLRIQSKEAGFVFFFCSSSCLFEWILHNALGITSHTHTHS